MVVSVCMGTVPDYFHIANYHKSTIAPHYARGKTVPLCEYHGGILAAIGLTLRELNSDEQDQECAICRGRSLDEQEMA